MLVMFAVFAVYFYYDGSVGYRQKNKVHYLYQTFGKAVNAFAAMDADGGVSERQWREFASQQSVDFPKDTSILPSDLELPMPWPDVLQDYERMKSLQWNQLWLEYSAEHQYPDTPSKEPYDARKIKEQWVFCYICSALTLVAAFILLRTLSRSISADENGVISHTGKKIAYSDMKSLDLRKWNSKGLAYIDYESSSGSGRFRLDGLTYGGFKKDRGAPAEELMKMIKQNFSGEIIEYEQISPEMAEDQPTEQNKEKS